MGLIWVAIAAGLAASAVTWAVTAPSREQRMLRRRWKVEHKADAKFVRAIKRSQRIRDDAWKELRSTREKLARWDAELDEERRRLGLELGLEGGASDGMVSRK